MSTFELMRWFRPDLTAEQINEALADARRRFVLHRARWHRQYWRRVTARASTAPKLSRMRAAYRAKARHR